MSLVETVWDKIQKLPEKKQYITGLLLGAINNEPSLIISIMNLVYQHKDRLLTELAKLLDADSTGIDSGEGLGYNDIFLAKELADDTRVIIYWNFIPSEFLEVSLNIEGKEYSRIFNILDYLLLFKIVKDASEKGTRSTELIELLDLQPDVKRPPTSKSSVLSLSKMAAISLGEKDWKKYKNIPNFAIDLINLIFTKSLSYIESFGMAVEVYIDRKIKEIENILGKESVIEIELDYATIFNYESHDSYFVLDVNAFLNGHHLVYNFDLSDAGQITLELDDGNTYQGVFPLSYDSIILDLITDVKKGDITIIELINKLKSLY